MFTAALSTGFSQTPSSAPPAAQAPVAAPSQQQPSLPPYDPDQVKSKPSAATPMAPVAQPVPQVAPAPVPPPDAPGKAEPPYMADFLAPPRPPKTDALGSAYIPMDSWVYPAMSRLYSMGFLDSAFLNLRPWTRRSALHAIQKSQSDIMNSRNEEAEEILAKLLRELEDEIPSGNIDRGLVYGIHTTYTRLMGIGGPVLRDSYHLGQTITNDYGRPYDHGFNNITGVSTLNEFGRFSLYVRGEYQHSASGPGYSYDLASMLSRNDAILPDYSGFNRPQDTIPEGPLPAQNNFRLVEASLSFHFWGHEISGGKNDAWLGPGQGGSMAWSNNAENIYSFRINRVEPLRIFLLSRLLGPVRYDFFYGSLKGHTYPNSPYVHSETLAFQPTKNLQMGFERTIIFGGAGHTPVTLHNFLKGFFHFQDTSGAEKYSRSDPGARFSIFTFSYRLPLVRNYATLYADTMAHDDVTPISAPRRAAYRTGLYISQFPGRLKPLDFRVEAVSTDPGVRPSVGGSFQYFETIQRQGYTNKGIIMGDWIGREAKGGQAWLTWHFSGNESLQLSYLNKKTPKDFAPGGTTQNQFKVSYVKRFTPEVELNAWVQYEGWKAPVYRTGYQQDTAAAFQMTWYPKLKHLPR